MYKEIIIALITAFGAVIGSYLANNKNIAVIQTQIEGVKQDISTLSTRVDKHNNLIERMAIVEQLTKSAHKRIDEISDSH